MKFRRIERLRKKLRKRALAARLGKTDELIFRTDWVSRHTDNWRQLLAEFVDKADIEALEIGCQEGRSSIWFLTNILTHPTARITCVDPFARPSDRSFFAHNINAAGVTHRVTLIAEPSEIALLRELSESRFDFVYIDGSHFAPNVLFDGLFVWPLVKPGGLVIFDDYEWNPDKPLGRRPKPAIDKFLEIHSDALEVLHHDYQVAVRKRQL